MRNAVSVQQKLVFPFLKKGDVTLSPLKSIFRSHSRPPLQLFFVRGRVLIQGVHHEHHIWPRWDRGVTRPHDFKAQEAERLQEWSYQREGNLLPSGIRYPLYLCCPRSHDHHSWLRGGLELCTPLRQPPGYPPAARRCLCSVLNWGAAPSTR